MMAKSVLSRAAPALAAVAALLGSAACTGVRAGRFQASNAPLFRANFDATHKFHQSSCCSKWCCKGAPLHAREIERDIQHMQSESELELYQRNVAHVAQDYRCCGKLYTIFGSLALCGLPGFVWAVGRCCCWNEQWGGYYDHGFCTAASVLQLWCGVVGITLFSCGGCMFCNACDVEEYANLLDSAEVRAHVAPDFFGETCGGVLGLLGLALLVCLVVCVLSALLGKNTKLNRFRPEDQMLVVDTHPDRANADLWGHGQHRLPGSGRPTFRQQASRTESGVYMNPNLHSQLAMGQRPMLAGEALAEDFVDDLESADEFEGHY